MTLKHHNRSFLYRFLKWSTILGGTGLILGLISVYGLYKHISPQLPDIEILKDIKYQVPLSIYSRDEKLIAQFGEKKRTPVKIADVPEQLVNAILAAEDDRFFEHPGVDYHGLLRAAFNLLVTGKITQGGSTITMQVARNFFLTREKTFMRKFKEIFLALKIEQQLGKREILELYLNKIFLGHHAYGVAAAAHVYYGRNISELDLAQLAMIAGLPKAPSKFNPITNPNRAIKRRNYVLRRMHKLGFISSSEFKSGYKQPITEKLHAISIELYSPHIAEMVRNQIVDNFGEEAYTSGYKVYTTIDNRRQMAAQNALYKALHDYDERHGYRGTESRGKGVSRKRKLKTLKKLPVIGDTVPALVSEVRDKSVTGTFADGERFEIAWDNLKWARKFINTNSQGPYPKTAGDILRKDDIIRVRRLDGLWRLAQVPTVQGALVSLDPNNGAIVALVGGFDYFQSKFNRATQAKRQPGSGFKPILYATALENGFTPASIINDAPVIYADNSSDREWRPQNYSGKFYGPTRLRVALTKSRNLVSIRLLRRLGVRKVVRSAMRFGLKRKQLPNNLSLALGSGTASPLEMARIFAVFANGGFLITPYYIDRIENLDGEAIFQTEPLTACRNCEQEEEEAADKAPRILSPQVHFLMHNMLQDVVQRGTGIRAMQLGRFDIAGKTGTTNEQRDAWFNGFTPDLVATAWMGFDTSKPLGNRETGSHAALPMWMYYMRDALEGIPEQVVEQPEGIYTMRIDPETGLLTSPDDVRAINEYFIAGRFPNRFAPMEKPVPYVGSDSADSPIRSLF
ncbi:MAG: penicillin-binding protein 1A [Pseudomonadota bacterium]